MRYLKSKKQGSLYINTKHSASAYERTIAFMIYERMLGICQAKREELVMEGTPLDLAKELAEIYVMTSYCEGHPLATYAIAQARLQLMREGYIPSNASTMPDPWSYDPYERLSLSHVEAIVGMNA